MVGLKLTNLPLSVMHFHCGKYSTTIFMASIDCMPPQTHRCSKITWWLGCSYPEDQQQHWSCTTRTFPSLLVLPTEEWQRDNVHCQASVMTGDKGRLGGLDTCLCPQGKQKRWLLCSLSYKLQSSFTKDSQTTLAIIHSVQVYWYSGRHSPWGV